MRNLTQNRHLNLFRAYNTSDFWENNLTRALAICLQNDPLFLYQFLSRFIPKAQEESLFSHLNAHEAQIHIQVDMDHLRALDCSNIYGFTLTSQQPEQALARQEISTDGKKITDLLILLEDLVLVIEVKRTKEDARNQLQAQLAKLDMPSSWDTISWEQVMEVIRNTRNTYALQNKHSIFIDDFKNLLVAYNVNWLPKSPFKNLDPEKLDKKTFLAQANKRLSDAKDRIKEYAIKEIGNRKVIIPDVKWASEVIPKFRYEESSKKVDFSIYIWPADVKWQGKYVYTKAVGTKWLQKNRLNIPGFGDFDLEIRPEVNFRSTYGKLLKSIQLEETSKSSSSLHTISNYKHSGKYTQSGKRTWAQLEALLDEQLAPSVPWKDEIDWEENFKNSNMTALVITFGYKVRLKINYKRLQELDQDDAGLDQVATFLTAATTALRGILD